MEAPALIRNLPQIIHRYKYAALILLIGLGLLLLPSRQEPTPPQTPQSALNEPSDLEEKLAQILTSIDGAGQVQVLLTEKSGRETLYQTDSQTDSDESGVSERSDTVLIDDNSRNQLGLVRRQDPPVYLGALVVCQGAGSPSIRLAVVQAVQCVTGLKSDQIQVVKMK